MKSIFDYVYSDFEAKLIEFNEESDYLDLLINYQQKVYILKFVNSLKNLLLKRNKSYF